MATEGRKLRHPGWRQDPGRPTRSLELKGRVVCPGCAGSGCDLCDRRGWMIDDSLGKEEWNPHGT